MSEKIVKHVRKDGSREHVVWWDSHGEHCSEKACEINHPRCHNTPMKHGCGESDMGSDFSFDAAEWFECKHCGCRKDVDGNVIKEDG